ncbi:uncharacterized protein BO88DRAFT_443625 [Aspergillus vadensis CBS 113365]|uniref:C2H2-type domain-containing protein n=1 Tax=Aspergillus vadensis (strain CBS 113365 / IMI 142717 / IBT 24658) TaxID=1448311 RepID=A0A319BA96_ASPVC|nr:hypothetical protein BO88DRAFT_443625 [Aspergillus vadensis CBS 113365]PYH69627.1 hypothetical protein BO88DRAFT_443625 [Aspergillus vadensis CBS 113365]
MDWSKTVFRLRALPDTVETKEDAARLLSKRLSDISTHQIWVYSLALTLNYWEDPPTKVATVMFDVPPSLVQRNPESRAWHIPARGHDRNSPDLILDTHFIGLTPLNDTNHLQNSYDCIAISGLASHPFGSWQRKGSNKRFMWIRDNLPKSVRGIRAILYGYDTELDGSSSFQTINDLAKQLIDQLQAHRVPESVTPLVFLAHSLGGLVVKQALRDLAENYPGNEHQALLSAVRGAVFFGVPNLGMEHSELEAIVHDKPNGVLIRDLSTTSNFIHQLSEAFSTNHFHERFKFFWAYETSVSPTVVRKADNRVTRDGPTAILVNKDSATCGFINTRSAITFAINESHSNMVKFDQGSQYYSTVRSKLLQILKPDPQPQHDIACDAQSSSVSHTVPDDVIQPLYQDDLADSAKSAAESLLLQPPPRSMLVKTLVGTTLSVLQHTIGGIQMQQELSRDMMYMGRLEPFLVSMEQFGQLAEDIRLFSNNSDSIAYVWGSMKYILETTCEHSKAFDSILNAYQSIGDEMPRLRPYQALFIECPHLRDVLVMIYKDVLLFHAEVIRHLKHRQWDQLFHAWMRVFTINIDDIAERAARNKRLIDNRVSLVEFEAIRKDDLISARAFEREKEAMAKVHRDTVEHWLSAIDIKAEHRIHQAKRRVCQNPGHWLLNSPELKTWSSIEDQLNPLLWLSGIPGAGKTVLASIVIDELSRLPGAIVAYFYCKHGDERRNSVDSVTRSILAQVLDQNPDLLPYYYEKAHMNASLTSSTVSERLLCTSLRSCRRVYIVLDGLDECGRAARKNIVNLFRQMVEQTVIDAGFIRCLFVSQEDGAAAEDFEGIECIKIGQRNFEDISAFARVWQQTIVTKFGGNNRLLHIQDHITKRAKGMFIFAELFAKYLEERLSLEDIEEQLRPDNLPVELDDLYERILSRIQEVRDVETMKRIKEMLGWIVCARRPLRWEEIQTTACISPTHGNFDVRRRLVDSPRELFASIVEYHFDGTVDLVHGTARKYLTKGGLERGLRKEPVVRVHQAHYSLAVRCLTYLSFPHFDLNRAEHDVKSDMLDGFHQLYDYASACWAMHLEGGILGLEEGDLTRLCEALKGVVNLHWSESHKPIQHVERVCALLSPFNAIETTESKDHNQLVQAVAWARKQSGQSGIGPCDEEALALWKVTARIRSVLENIDTKGDEFKTIKRLYGVNRFKCPRVNCYYYHHGFRFLDQRNRHAKRHTRPYLCVVAGCPMEVFGYALEKELQKHLFDVHHINDASDGDEPDFPNPIREKTSKSGRVEGKFRCTDCDKTFTQKKSLNRHQRSHASERSFLCTTCGKPFTRKEDCERHQGVHSSDKQQYVCAGTLKDGTKWGCNKSFARKDHFKNHFRPEKKNKCILPWLREKQAAGDVDGKYLDGNVFADQKGANAEVLLMAGQDLPPFRVFLERCGL